MGDSACLMHGFSYASAIPNESKQGNPIHSLGQSVSFGRFMTESLSWEKWSTFSHKKYVEEAERYAQPGSVAQKKAFFEAHYKRIAAQKAAALLEQENAAKKGDVKEDEGRLSENNAVDQQNLILYSHLDACEKSEVKIQGAEEDGSVIARENAAIVENEISVESPVKTISINGMYNLEKQDTISVSESSGTPQMERPLLKQNSVANEENPSVTSKKRSGFSSLKSSMQRKTWAVPSTPAKPVTPYFTKENSVTQSTRKSNVNSMDKKKSSPKSLRSLINFIPTKEPDKGPSSAAKKTESSGLALNSSKAPKDCATPLRTPFAATKVVSKHPTATPRSENRRTKTSVDSSAPGNKTTGPKWHILSAVCSKSLTACRNKLQSPTSSTPFILRTEERAAKRKQKLEEKFNANEVQKVQVQKTLKEKAGNEFKKLSRSFCFKARPLPDFYKDRETPKIQIKTTPVTQRQTAVLGKSLSSKTQGNISMPPPPPPPTSFAKSGAPKNLSKKNVPNLSKFLTTSLPERMTYENQSPNIQL